MNRLGFGHTKESSFLLFIFLMFFSSLFTYATYQSDDFILFTLFLLCTLGCMYKVITLFKYFVTWVKQVYIHLFKN